ncbi:dTDP-4-dehydrorhamnose 3,5-epimerase [Candidatus Kinetoplastidibacterium crithidiae]|uniref:dTDP-4-dehydrorhamnose 3,5-epimerase n=1 Tax=Candidatus Kinetoplastidibacterium crithidiae TCC036E TaxID=1208918 RepID=M1M5K4_9PROT|nr:dTDP-4-dehydrorhamnose 3,5-epimerase [Candidatus Kinetoplastibacterium crithidii]AFZ83169.1 dTDP-4-dehydrorhamnose 3,5-epimerase [Candidatus Kinetoplastibacterium crithidii (ex Angomonas deanei ATCC 30255)]AGF47445.1 dTDP-4-dehydrorhamnose 3,5-epimerase [Candidatus Kinetoplastibacterium crithidii TCC036E]
MITKPLTIQNLLIIKPKIFRDTRGSFFESFNSLKFQKLVMKDYPFVQDNCSISKHNVLRGLHFQTIKPQAKLIQVLYGKIFDVVVDLRYGSSTFGKWESIILKSSNREQLWIPEGFAHGFLVLSKKAIVLYKTTQFYQPNLERCIVWNDETLKINWPIKDHPIVSEKDRKGQKFKDFIN